MFTSESFASSQSSPTEPHWLSLWALQIVRETECACGFTSAIDGWPQKQKKKKDGEERKICEHCCSSVTNSIDKKKMDF